MAKCYLARQDADNLENNWYFLGTKKKDWNGNSFGVSNIDMWCPEDFEKFTNIKLKAGQIRKVKFINFLLEK
jgi:hypothetical protein